MTTKTKTFDCVELKSRIQAERLAEYEARKGEFTSYLDFINARMKDSKLAAVVCRKVQDARSNSQRMPNDEMSNPENDGPRL